MSSYSIIGSDAIGSALAGHFASKGIEVNDGYAVTGLEHVGLGRGFYHRGLISKRPSKFVALREDKNPRSVIKEEVGERDVKQSRA